MYLSNSGTTITIAFFSSYLLAPKWVNIPLNLNSLAMISLGCSNAYAFISATFLVILNEVGPN